MHVGLYEWSGGRVGSFVKNMPHVILRGVGRRSGKPFAVCLPYWLDDAGTRIVAASYSGAAKNPAWFHNVKDRQANPTVRVRDRAHTFDARIEILAGADREGIWRELVVDRPFYARYQAQTTREIPLLRIVEEHRPA